VIKRVAVVELGVNNGSGDGGGCFGIEVWTDTAKLTDIVNFCPSLLCDRTAFVLSFMGTASLGIADCFTTGSYPTQCPDRVLYERRVLNAINAILLQLGMQLQSPRI